MAETSYLCFECFNWYGSSTVQREGEVVGAVRPSQRMMEGRGRPLPCQTQPLHIRSPPRAFPCIRHHESHRHIRLACKAGGPRDGVGDGDARLRAAVSVPAGPSAAASAL